MGDRDLLFIQRNDVAKRAFFNSGDVRFVITTLLPRIVINGAMARVFLFVRRMQRLFKGMKYFVETFNLHISSEVQKEEQQSGEYPSWFVLNYYPFAIKCHFLIRA